MKEKKILSVDKVFPYNKVGSWKRTDPFVIAFVYPQWGKSFIVKGGIKDVKTYIKSKTPVCIVHYTTFYMSLKRSYVKIYGANDGLEIKFNPVKKPVHGGIFYGSPAIRCNISVANKLSKEGFPLFRREFRHPPRCWVKELNPYVKSISMAENIDSAVEHFINNTP